MSAVNAQTDVTPRPPLHAVPPPAQRRRTLPNRVAYALAASVIGLGLFASITPSPLYHAYSVLWHFSPLTLTLIYATYAFGVLASLLLVGGVSDDVGRRPVLLVALGGLMAATVLFIARRLRGLAVRGARDPGRFHRGGAQRRQRGAAGPASAPRSDGRRAHQRRGGHRRDRPRHPRLILAGRGSGGNRAFCPTPCCWSSPRSRSPAPTGCRNPCTSARASG